ncbi:MAG: tRNA (adenine-N1)-methyltransferase [Nitrososphaerota archaeon]|nr:tRNA (adenine-N1)-methyltransferase [Nitrososphaerota archaeon]
MAEKVSAGDYVLLYSKGKTWLVRASEERDFHTHVGRVSFSGVIGRPFGSGMRTDTGDLLYALKPTLEDFIMKCERQTQIVYPKDLGLMALRAGIGPGSRVVEAGSGSGAFTIYLAGMVRPEGHVYSYEVREEFMKIAERNARKAGVSDFVTFHLKDASQGFEEKDADAAVIDVGDPWEMIGPAWDALKPSGGMVAVTPTMNQMERLVEEMKRSGFIRVHGMEVLLRNMEAREGKTRPSTIMVGHTAYLISGTKVLEVASGADEGAPEDEGQAE